MEGKVLKTKKKLIFRFERKELNLLDSSNGIPKYFAVNVDISNVVTFSLNGALQNSFISTSPLFHVLFFFQSKVFFIELHIFIDFYELFFNHD